MTTEVHENTLAHKIPDKHVKCLQGIFNEYWGDKSVADLSVDERKEYIGDFLSMKYVMEINISEIDHIDNIKKSILDIESEYFSIPRRWTPEIYQTVSQINNGIFETMSDADVINAYHNIWKNLMMHRRMIDRPVCDSIFDKALAILRCYRISDEYLIEFPSTYDLCSVYSAALLDINPALVYNGWQFNLRKIIVQKGLTNVNQTSLNDNGEKIAPIEFKI